ncbi:MAG TPA: response regulator [Tepidisphaeraceae bacterium]|jgi:CheY-like chemotaxis protein|nr:response regulator [Tepidisphaeraceae bacterium]
MGRILIVDDCLEQCIPLLRLMHQTGHAAACVSTGETALGMVRLTKPDLVLLDAMMPDMDGTQVLREIRSDPLTADLPVIMYTSLSDTAFHDHLRSLGASDCWVKATLGFDEMEERFTRLLPVEAMIH